jgi:hypothetical protein
MNVHSSRVSEVVVLLVLQSRVCISRHQCLPRKKRLQESQENAVFWKAWTVSFDKFSQSVPPYPPPPTPPHPPAATLFHNLRENMESPQIFF